MHSCMMRISFFIISITLTAVSLAGVFLYYFLQLQSASLTDSSFIQSDTKSAQIIPIKDTELNHVVLTERATQRLAIATVPVQVATSAQARQENGRTIIPYSAVIYDPNGATWTYTNPETFVYVRHPITIVYIEEDFAVLSSGPPSDTRVVTVGAAELFGAEFGVGK